MRKLILAALALLLFASLASADLKSFPEPFISSGNFAGQIVVGGETAPSTDVLAASDVAVFLQQQSSSRITAKTDSEASAGVDSILVGLPCHNSLVAGVLGMSSCDIGIPENTGYIKLVEKEGVTFLIVMGNAPTDTRRAARLIAEGSRLSGTDIVVTGTLDVPQAEEKTLTLAEASPSQPSAGQQPSPPAAEESPQAQEEPKEEATVAATPAAAADAAATATASAEAQPEKAAEAPPKTTGFFSRIISFFRNLFR